MSTKVLRLDSSIFGSGGASTQLNEQVIETLKSRHGDVEVVHRDLARKPLPHFTVEFIQALGKAPEERTAEEAAQVALADQLIKELREADILVIGAPMYNFTIPTTLKTWMDYVARAGETFKYTENGPVGLVGDAKIYINTSRGGVHKGQPTDGIVPLLKSFFAMMSLTDISVVYAEGLTLGGDSRSKGLAEAERAIATA